MWSRLVEFDYGPEPVTSDWLPMHRINAALPHRPHAELLFAFTSVGVVCITTATEHRALDQRLLFSIEFDARRRLFRLSFGRSNYVCHEDQVLSLVDAFILRLLLLQSENSDDRRPH